MAMDGNFYNIFPYKKKEYILGTPKYSKFKKISNLKTAINFITKIKQKDIIKRKINSENLIKKTFVNFNNFFRYSGYFFSLTTIFNSKSDNRPTLVKKKNNVASNEL